jgi:hypothetical protein
MWKPNGSQLISWLDLGGGVDPKLLIYLNIYRRLELVIMAIVAGITCCLAYNLSSLASQTIPFGLLQAHLVLDGEHITAGIYNFPM